MKTLFDLPFEEPEPPPPAAPVRRIRTVTELTADVRQLLEGSFGDVWVEGEISNCRLWNTGHLYFTLKDSGAQLRAVMFRSALRYLRFKPEDGLHVVARGRVGVYERKGEYQIVCEHMEPHGTGALQVAFEQLKRRLEHEGLFDQARKRPLPALPRRIGIVTSLDGAALRDVLKVLQRRHPTAHVLIRPSRVQGEGAKQDLARALHQIGQAPGVEVVIVGRGGGSVEDLWAFNEELVARAIAACPVPVIAAVGHEIDFTIADFVADLRAPTPSAAAEMVVARQDEFASRIDRLRDRLISRVTATRAARLSALRLLESRPGLAGFRTRVVMRGRQVVELGQELERTARTRLGDQIRRHGALTRRLEAHDLSRRLPALGAQLLTLTGHLRALATARVHRGRARLAAVAGRLESLSPLAVLGRGYAVCWTADRTRIIREAAAVAQGDGVRVTLARGELECEVKRAREG